MIVDQKSTKPFVGVYLIDNDIKGTQLAMSSKPNFFRRLCIRIFFGWRWVSINKIKKV